jgi:ComF family protein
LVAGSLLRVVFPEDCLLCNQSIQSVSRYPVCSSCLNAVAPLAADQACRSCQTPFLYAGSLDETGVCRICRTGIGADKVLAYGWYENSLRQLIRAYKYQAIQPLSGPLSSFLIRTLPREAAFDRIVPVPQHWHRLIHRGFDQVGLLAKNLAAVTGIPVDHALIRKRHTESQAGQSGSIRRRQLQGVFAIKNSPSVSGGRILLIDDVITTGSTVLECARVLKRAGAVHVTALAVARTDRRSGIKAL